MLKKVVSLLLVLTICSCITYRNDHGRKRFNCCKFTMKPNSNDLVYKIIDTTKLYKIVSVVNLPDGKPLANFNTSYLKFYGNGKVGTFYTYDEHDINSLNPEKSDIGIYSYTKEVLTIQTYFHHVQGGGFVKDRLQKKTPNTLEFVGDELLTTYITLDIPDKWLIYKPDW